LKVELFLDEDIHLGYGRALRQRGYDVVHAQELERKGLSDLSQLAYAVDQQRCLFTFNVRDFVILHNQHVESQKDHWGIIVTKQMPLRTTLRKLLQLIQFKNKETIKNRLAFLR
jgi:predicted nuclease of predicted toxin-antitoxin system